MNLNTESELRDKLELKCLFLQFLRNVTAPDQLYDDNSRKMIDETRDFVYHSTLDDFLNRVEEVSLKLDKLITDSVSLIPLKVSPEEVARKFRDLLQEQGEYIYLNGVTFG